MNLVSTAAFDGKDGRRIKRRQAFVTDEVYGAELIANGLAKKAIDGASENKAIVAAPENRARGKKAPAK